MSLFDIDYNIKSIEWLPPDKRFPAMVGWIQSFLGQCQYLRDKILGNYRLGYTGQQWLTGFAYSAGQTALYKQVVYQSLVDANTDTPPSVNWVVYLPSFIGVNNRVLFNGQYTVLTYALNQYFFTNFRQPGLYGYGPGNTPAGAPYSDIYITNNAYQIVGFHIGENDCVVNEITHNVTQVISSSIAQNDIGDTDYDDWTASITYSMDDIVIYPGAGEGGYLFLSLVNDNDVEPSIGDSNEPPAGNWHRVDAIGWSSPFLSGDNFTIWVPVLVYNSFAHFEQDCRNFLANLVPAGINYNIKTY